MSHVKIGEELIHVVGKEGKGPMVSKYHTFKKYGVGLEYPRIEDEW